MDQVKTAVIETLAKRKRVNKITDLEQLARRVSSDLKSEVDLEEVIEAFRTFADQGQGSLIRRRGNNPTRFIWKYNLKEAAEKALGKRQDVSPLDELGRAIRSPKVETKRPVGRPKGYKKPKVISFQMPKADMQESKVETTPAALTINLVGVTAKDLVAALDLLKDIKSK